MAAENLCDHSISGCDFGQSLQEREKRREKKRKRLTANKEKRDTDRQQNTCSNLLKDPAGYADEVDDDYDGQCPQIYQVDNN